MKRLKNEEMMQITGGINWNGTIINALAKAVNTLLELGRALGSSIRRIAGGNYCPIS